jgi:hypothetical protein
VALLAVAFIPALFLPRGKAPVDPEVEEKALAPVGL